MAFLALVAGTSFAKEPYHPDNSQQQSSQVQTITIEGAPVLGDADAVITIVEFTDYQCPFCARAHKTMKKILKTYSGKVKLVQKQFPLPFHQNAKPAALAALCANEQKSYQKYTELLWENQRELDKKDLFNYAKRARLKMGPFKKCFNKERYLSQIEAEIKEGKKQGVRGTPTFIINGQSVSGARPYEYFKGIIDAELSHVLR